MVTKNTSIDLSGDSSPDSAAAPGGGQSTGDPNAGTGNTLDISDPTHILSNGRYLDATKPMIALTFDDGPKA
jgi:peptidoglycan/xylan/chitin deacetylase (PgdA/CDA1 family)